MPDIKETTRAVCYKITREDGKEYIGVTSKLNARLLNHKYSERFSKSKILKHEILFEGSYKECEPMEEKFIIQYDTYNNGLNKTKSGKGMFGLATTLGTSYPQEMKDKLSVIHSGKKSWNKGKTDCYSEETKKKWSETRKGNIYCKLKVSLLDRANILKMFDDRVEIPSEIARKNILKNHLIKLDSGEFKTYYDCKSRNGHTIKYKTLFAAYIATLYPCTSQNITGMLKHAKKI